MMSCFFFLDTKPIIAFVTFWFLFILVLDESLPFGSFQSLHQIVVAFHFIALSCVSCCLVVLYFWWTCWINHCLLCHFLLTPYRLCIGRVMNKL